MSAPTRLEALYDELADNRATQAGVYVESWSSKSIHDFESHLTYAESLVSEENALVEEIESLGGEDPEL